MSQTSGARGTDEVRGLRRWMPWLLIASLAFNVLVIGAMASRAFLVRHGAAIVAPVGGGPNLIGFIGTLQAERRREIWTATAAERKALRPLRAAVREARVGVREALATEPFDGKKVEDAHQRLLQAEVALRTQSQRLIARIAGQLSPDERRRFAVHVTADPIRGPRRGPPGWLRDLEAHDEKGPSPGR